MTVAGGTPSSGALLWAGSMHAPCSLSVQRRALDYILSKVPADLTSHSSGLVDSKTPAEAIGFVGVGCWKHTKTTGKLKSKSQFQVLVSRRYILSEFRASQGTSLGKENSQGGEGSIFIWQPYPLITNISSGWKWAGR